MLQPCGTYPLLGTAGLERAPQLLAPGRVLRVVVQAAPVQVTRAPARLPFLHGRGCHSCRGHAGNHVTCDTGISPRGSAVRTVVPVRQCRPADPPNAPGNSLRKCPPRIELSGPPSTNGKAGLPVKSFSVADNFRPPGGVACGRKLVSDWYRPLHTSHPEGRVTCNCGGPDWLSRDPAWVEVTELAPCSVLRVWLRRRQLAKERRLRVRAKLRFAMLEALCTFLRAHPKEDLNQPRRASRTPEQLQFTDL